MGQDIDYAKFIAELKARRAAIDAAIAGAELLMGQAPSAPDAGGAPGPPASVEQDNQVDLPTQVVAGTFHGLSVRAAAKKYLRMVRRKQRLVDISNALLRGGIESTAKSFITNVYNALKRDKEFMKSGSQWGLAEWWPGRVTAPNKPARKRRAKNQAIRRPAKQAETTGSTPTKGKPGAKAVLPSIQEVAG